MSDDRFSSEHKAKIVARFDEMDPGERGIMLNELHLSHTDIIRWRNTTAKKGRQRTSTGERIMQMLKREEFLNEGLIDEDIAIAAAEINAILSQVRCAERKQAAKADEREAS